MAVNPKLKKAIPAATLVVGVLAAALYIFLTADIKSTDDYYNPDIKQISPGDETAFVAITCEVLIGKECNVAKEFIPDDGIILPRTEYALEEGDTAFDLLLRSVRHNRIHFEFQGDPERGAGSVYIKGINHIYEFSCGPLSGWLFKINGEFASKDASSYVLEDNDRVEWIYTLDLGRDVGNEFSGDKDS